MSLLKISAAFEKRLKALDSSFPTAVENLPFTPVTGTAYQRIRLLPATPENPTMGDNYHRETGFCEIVLFYHVNTGRGAAQVKAEAIKNHFPRNLSLTEAGQVIKIDRTPSVNVPIQVDDRYCIPITISYFSEIFT
jgi:uncharacterized membrane protein